jgi:acyl-CoA reductase-like NAD-dependent aldehyde dehydrogenase
MHLNDPRLLRSDCYIDGRWEAADDGRTLAVSDPASGYGIAEVPLMTAVETGGRSMRRPRTAGVAGKDGQGARRRAAPLV